MSANSVNIHASMSPSELDAADALGAYRRQFVIPEGVIYLDGNSLGPASYAALAALETAAKEEWAQGMIRSWNSAGWFNLPVSVGDKIAPIVGAEMGQVVACDTITVNLYKLLHAALALNPGRRKIVAEASSFPTDLYVAQGVTATLPDVTLALAEEGKTELTSLIDAETAVVLVNHVDYRTGALRNMQDITRQAQAAGALVIWDLSHSAGALDVALDACGVDFAVGCTYKYLNAGPGAPAFVYAAKRHHAHIKQPLTGWWGHARPFAFETGYDRADGVRAFLTGTQPVLSFRTLSGALDIWEDVDLSQVRRKSLQLTQYFIERVKTECAAHDLVCITPEAPEQRGSQVSFQFEHAYEAIQALIDRGVIGDFRAPNVMRFGFTPLYLGFTDVAHAVAVLKEVLDTQAWKDPKYSIRTTVT